VRVEHSQLVACLDDTLITAFAEGQLEPNAMLEANAHARGCLSCHGRLISALRLSVTNGATVEEPLSPPKRRIIAADLLTPGTAVGRYTVLAMVGRGGMGQVYSAYDPKLDRRIALKLMHPQEDARDARAQDRLLREAQSIARLSHPNVVVVHDVGTFADRVFIAMEFIDGETLDAWVKAQTRTWRAILDVYLQAARGVAAAHGAGLVHRDLKPHNVMVSRQGAVRVTDFGIARRIGTADEAPPPGVEGESPAVSSAATLTHPGERLGTPRYMAPEQFRGERADARSDQYAFCVALHEALYGIHPFIDDGVAPLSPSGSRGVLRTPPGERDVPRWIRRVLVRGLSVRAEDRYPSMAALVAALEADPAVGTRRRLVAVGVVALVAAMPLVAREVVVQRRAELNRRVDAALGEATSLLLKAQATARDIRDERARAFNAFDARDDGRGEAAWQAALAQIPKADAAYADAERAFEKAELLSSTRTDAHERCADARLEHLVFEEELGIDDRARALEAALAQDDPGGQHLAHLREPGALQLAVKPEGVAVTLERYRREPATKRRVPDPLPPPARGVTTLPAGSYRLELHAPDGANVFVPFEIQRGQRTVVDVRVPPARAIPPDFAYVPAGEFWFGERDEGPRVDFLHTVPIHRRHAEAFMIARHETTFREWLAFVARLPRHERQRYLPNSAMGLRGVLRVRELGTGWELTFDSGRRYTARSGELLEYEGRQRLARQQWLDFPVAGISVPIVERYLAWLSETGRVPAARLCTELEWERAARGADDRPFPHGDDLAGDDANIDVTYGRASTAYGPDVVGSHPASRSPFGVDDLAGNVWEFTKASIGPDELQLRGGGFYFGVATARATNREASPRDLDNAIVGFRVCAPAP
jgi:formylglycine-generating enzyme required for sulfatase activity